jgi:hypothetical protein
MCGGEQSVEERRDSVVMMQTRFMLQRSECNMLQTTGRHVWYLMKKRIGARKPRRITVLSSRPVLRESNLRHCSQIRSYPLLPLNQPGNSSFRYFNFLQVCITVGTEPEPD